MSTALQPPCPVIPPPRHEPKLTRHPSPDLSPSSAAPSTPNTTPDQPESTKDKPLTDEPKDDEIVDMDTLAQIRELDEDEDDREFSTGMVEAYFEQVEETFKDMDSALEKKDLEKLSSLGHFLKGSSAALGVIKVQSSCEKIQCFGQRRDPALSDQDALAKINIMLSQVKEEYAAAEKWLRDWLVA